MDKKIYEKVSKRLKQARENNNITLEDAGKKVDVHKSTILRWENGETEKIKLPMIKLLADYYNVDPTWLMGYDVPMERQQKIDKNIQGMGKSTEKGAVVFVYGTIPAGMPVECIEDIIDTEEISADMLKGNKQYFGLKVKGDSMYPEYLDGDTLILLKQDNCENGEDCVIMVNGQDGTFKRVFKNENGIILQPLNNAYAPVSYTNKEIEELPVRILGIVEEIRRKKRKK